VGRRRGAAEYEMEFLKAERQFSLTRTTVFPFYSKKNQVEKQQQNNRAKIIGN
jgi:hypothetical protein